MPVADIQHLEGEQILCGQDIGVDDARRGLRLVEAELSDGHGSRGGGVNRFLWCQLGAVSRRTISRAVRLLQ